MTDIGHPTPRVHYPDWETATHDLAIHIQRIMQGKLNNAGSFTCTANADSTVVTDYRVGANSVILPSATTANAAAELATLYFTPTKNSFTVNHANNAQSDRTFSYAVIG